MQPHDALWFVPFFLLVWCSVCAVLARLGGWHSLARHYRALGKPNGKRFGMQSARFGWVDYNGCLSIRVAAEGLYIAMWPMFRLAHPPLLIPWSALRVLGVNDRWWRRDVTLAVGMPEIARIRLPLRVVSAAEGLQSAVAEGEKEGHG
jgi:hypothetical protein